MQDTLAFARDAGFAPNPQRRPRQGGGARQPQPRSSAAKDLSCSLTPRGPPRAGSMNQYVSHFDKPYNLAVVFSQNLSQTCVCVMRVPVSGQQCCATHAPVTTNHQHMTEVSLVRSR